MFNLLIADDEELERRAIRSILDKNFEGLFTIHEAKNGREAIEVADRVKPDILIMDIKMPGINGMEAIKEIRKFLREGYFIVLTAYDYFDYAKEAIEYDVKEYMLKPFKKNEFIEKINQAVSFIENVKNRRREEIFMKEKIFTLIPMMENELCYSIINDSIENLDYSTYLGYLGMQFEYGYSVIVRFTGMDHSEKTNLKFKVNDYIKEIIKRQNNAISSCIFTDDIFLFVEASEQEANIDDRSTIAQKVAESIRERFKVDVVVGVGKVCCSVEKLSKSFKEALMVVSVQSEEKDNSFYKNYYELGAEERNARERLSEVEKGGRENFSEGRNVILKAVEYINENFRKDIMLEEVAGFVNISSFYFSKIFKEYTGKNYVDYITDLRIDIAKEKLMEGIISIKEICYEVGYNDPNYFSRVFKKVVGLSPTEFKSKYADKGK